MSTKSYVLVIKLDAYLEVGNDALFLNEANALEVSTFTTIIQNDIQQFLTDRFSKYTGVSKCNVSIHTKAKAENTHE